MLWTDYPPGIGERRDGTENLQRHLTVCLPPHCSVENKVALKKEKSEIYDKMARMVQFLNLPNVHVHDVL